MSSLNYSSVVTLHSPFSFQGLYTSSSPSVWLAALNKTLWVCLFTHLIILLSEIECLHNLLPVLLPEISKNKETCFIVLAVNPCVLIVGVNVIDCLCLHEAGSWLLLLLTLFCYIIVVVIFVDIDSGVAVLAIIVLCSFQCSALSVVWNCNCVCVTCEALFFSGFCFKVLLWKRLK